MRIGFGFDVHKFNRRKKYILLGGLKIDCGFGVVAVSDGDVILHAVCDAILGAASLGDIGDYFPPREEKSRGIKSIDIAGFVLDKIKGVFSIRNIDITIIADKPPLSSHKSKMVKSIRRIFRAKNINVKIKSKEGLDILGSKNAVSCFAIALLARK
ncbi:MAG: 2-C-methyl-D-erythritol 2,4-cyclodiphosphate synthase [Candidatus Omnitrophica bacterium 4484_171]|nr:MAG: 2-C-methyl-D-erythritol 2,4-cyclodiphosphate synthase [Candidatus Omnitrophica bacterium 4484_171]